MKCRITVSFLMNEDDTDMAEIELESQLSDLMNTTHTTLDTYEIINVAEIEEEDDE